MPARPRLGWAALGVLVAAFILVPFAAVGARLEAWTAASLAPGEGSALPVALLVAGLLAADIVLPVPSSIVSTAAGYYLGVVGGTLASFAGMTASCLAGYRIGSVWGRAAAVRLVGASRLDAMAGRMERRGAWAVAVGRPVPVLAEASVLLAGVARLPFRRFLLVSSLSNLGISLVYSAAGALSATAGSFFLALAAAVLVPAAASHLLRRREARERLPAPASTE
jgi:uncharacterized membrane protein YdjX (TVP38/TMEM64 family)